MPSSVRIEIPDRIYEVLQNKLKKGAKSYFFESLFEAINTDDDMELENRLKKIIFGDFTITFNDNKEQEMYKKDKDREKSADLDKNNLSELSELADAF